MYLLFNIGGTKMRIAAAENTDAIDTAVMMPTPRSFEDGMATFEKAARDLLQGQKPDALSGGIAGTFASDRRALITSPNLPNWTGKPLADRLEKIFGVPVLLANDAMLEALGEATEGAGKGHRIVGYITVGTGIGGCRIVNGRIDEYASGFEPGFQIIDLTGDPCPTCALPLYLETYVSGTAVKARYGMDPAQIDDPAIRDELARALAYGLNNTIVHWSPDIIVLGGGMIMGENPIPLERIRFHLAAVMKIFPRIPPVEKSALGEKAGFYGALEFLAQHENQKNF